MLSDIALKNAQKNEEQQSQLKVKRRPEAACLKHVRLRPDLVMETPEHCNPRNWRWAIQFGTVVAALLISALDVILKLVFQMKYASLRDFLISH